MNLLAICGTLTAVLFDMTPLSPEQKVQEYESAGNYAAALEAAREVHLATTSLEEKLLTLGSSRLLFDENNKPRARLIELLQRAGMEPSSDVEKINQWAQTNLLRKGERWEAQNGRFEALKSTMIPLLTELGFTEASLPHFTNYQGALVHGALLSRVRLRLNYLVEQWRQGTRFSHIYFLSGDRPLESSEDIKDEQGSPLKTESEMMRAVWEQSDIPEEMRGQVEVHFICAPMKDGKRPTTDDTIVSWLQANPPVGRYLAVTNAPYMNRQDLVIRTLAPESYTFDTIGPKASENERVAIFLDELARYIFQFWARYRSKLALSQ